MIYIVLSILCSTFIFIAFKSFEVFKIDVSKAIVVNYITAFLFGFLTYSKPIRVGQLVMEAWFYGAILLGILFIVIFNVMAITAQKNGLSVASVASKMSVVIPVIFSIFVYKETVTSILIIGIVLALVSVYLTSSKTKTVSNLKRNLTLPIILFVGSGIIDTTLKFFQTHYIAKDDISIFSATIFLMAAVLGLVQLLFKKSFSLNIKIILGGVALGLVNFGSIYFIIKSLQLDDWTSSTIFTLNNVGIVMLSTLVGKFIFKEQLLIKNWIGIGFAVISIVIITIAE